MCVAAFLCFYSISFFLGDSSCTNHSHVIESVSSYAPQKLGEEIRTNVSALQEMCPTELFAEFSSYGRDAILDPSFQKADSLIVVGISKYIRIGHTKRCTSFQICTKTHMTENIYSIIS